MSPTTWIVSGLASLASRSEPAKMLLLLHEDPVPHGVVRGHLGRRTAVRHPDAAPFGLPHGRPQDPAGDRFAASGSIEPSPEHAWHRAQPAFVVAVVMLRCDMYASTRE